MWNTWREQIVCPVDKLVLVPDGLDDPAAATSYMNPLTAWALTRSSHNLKEGDWLLQTAAASSVGKLVLQLAQQGRFKTINVIRRREQETIIRNLGGNEVICTEDKDLTGREGGWFLRHGNLTLLEYKLWNGSYSSLLRELCALGLAVPYRCGTINGTTRVSHDIDRAGIGTRVYSLGTPRQIEF